MSPTDVQVGGIYRSAAGRLRKVVAIIPADVRGGAIVRYLTPHYLASGEMRPPGTGLNFREVALKSFAGTSRPELDKKAQEVFASRVSRVR